LRDLFQMVTTRTKFYHRHLFALVASVWLGDG
jgi:hypothetical protein